MPSDQVNQSPEGEPVLHTKSTLVTETINGGRRSRWRSDPIMATLVGLVLTGGGVAVEYVWMFGGRMTASETTLRAHESQLLADGVRIGKLEEQSAETKNAIIRTESHLETITATIERLSRQRDRELEQITESIKDVSHGLSGQLENLRNIVLTPVSQRPAPDRQRP